MMQEGPIEDNRTIDPERCKRLLWLGWTIEDANSNACIRVFKQAPRSQETSWVLWLHEDDYAVILWERNGYYLLKTAFLVKPHKRQEFERDWKKYTENQNG